jgi:DNA-binding MarR family transcriptional regulator
MRAGAGAERRYNSAARALGIQQSHANRRGVRVKLSALGLATINESVTAHVENELRILRHLSRWERSLLVSLLRRLLLSLEGSVFAPQR